MSHLSQAEKDQLEADLYSIIQILKGNDVAIMDNNLRVSIKNLQELVDSIKQRKMLPTEDELNVIAGSIATKVEAILKQKGLIDN